ncbi:hypothetical protein SEA_STEVIEBAY_45 [Arthrobacter phage StevieBAY]|uniref:Uncharacterized protein n=1 Tax=Arthrobacter phage StevieBAY TaxID=2725609 RepID=A0A6M3T524_9CAUD|nr:hypothetical protein SEA_STEVIEBAY_45 [Arthrobacter phage StevieBAY]
MMNFEDLPPHVQQQIEEQMLNEEPEININMRPADVKAVRELKAEQEQQAEAAAGDTELLNLLRNNVYLPSDEDTDAPMDFVQLYRKVEKELDAFKDGEQWQDVTTAAVIQLVSHYCAAASEQRIVDLKETCDALAEAIRASEHQLTIEQHKNRELLRENSIAFAVLEAHMDPACVEIITNEQIVKAGRGLNKYRVQIEEQPMMQRVRVTLVKQSDSDV